ncbi:MAG: single-stranded DNA-binding protein [Candidatus Doudnabacteria bacterium]|nr:single-stranded DNA-binding protein [Candidatus Doudnabacteria bacterium]
MDLNKAQIIGRLTRDPESRSTPGGQQVATFSVATGFSWTDQQGQKQERTEFHNVVAWRKLAEICSQYLTKGKQVYIEGRLQTRSWEGQDGQKRYRTEIVADNMIMLGSAGGAQNTASQVAPVAAAAAVDSAPVQQEQDASSSDEISIEDIPF